MADYWELEDGTGRWELEDGSGLWLLEAQTGDGGGAHGGRGIQELITKKQEPIEEILLEQEKISLPIRITANQAEKIKLIPRIAIFSSESIQNPIQIIYGIKESIKSKIQFIVKTKEKIIQNIILTIKQPVFKRTVIPGEKKQVKKKKNLGSLKSFALDQIFGKSVLDDFDDKK